MDIEQPLIEICDCESKYTIQPHGDAYALYFGRCMHRHGYNLMRISEVAHNCPSIEELEQVFNKYLAAI
jgi:hypothetical protein